MNDRKPSYDECQLNTSAMHRHDLHKHAGFRLKPSTTTLQQITRKTSAELKRAFLDVAKRGDLGRENIRQYKQEYSLGEGFEFKSPSIN